MTSAKDTDLTIACKRKGYYSLIMYLRYVPTIIRFYYYLNNSTVITGIRKADSTCHISKIERLLPNNVLTIRPGDRCLRHSRYLFAHGTHFRPRKYARNTERCWSIYKMAAQLKTRAEIRATTTTRSVRGRTTRSIDQFDRSIYPIGSCFLTSRIRI